MMTLQASMSTVAKGWWPHRRPWQPSRGSCVAGVAILPILRDCWGKSNKHMYKIKLCTNVSTRSFFSRRLQGHCCDNLPWIYILTYTFFINCAILNWNLCLFESVEIWICTHWRTYICIESLPKHFNWCFRPSDREKKGHIQNCWGEWPRGNSCLAARLPSP